MMPTQPFEVDQFDGGITDNYIDGPANKYRYADNFILTTHKKLFTRPGSDLYDESNPQIPLGAQRISTIINFNNNSDLLIHSARRLYYYDAGWTELTGPTGNPVFESGSATTKMSHSEWNKQLFVTNDNYVLPTKLFKDGVGTWQVRTAGLPELASDPTITPGIGLASYIYAFVYEYSYTVGTISYLDSSDVTQILITNAATPDASIIAISDIPVITNTATSNYDTVNIKVGIYRSIDGGDTLYRVGQVNNGTTVFNDNVLDDALILNTTLYTTGGNEAQGAPPLSKYVHTASGFTYYANVKSGSEEYPYRIYQSLQSNPDGVPSGFFVDLEDQIIGISSYNFNVVVGTNNSIYRLDGFYDTDGSGGITFQKIKDTIGLISQNSFVQTHQGLYFAADDGFYWTDGFQAEKLSSAFNRRYKDIVANNPENIYGTYDPENDRIIWSMKSDNEADDNDVIYCMDLNFGVKPDMPFTTWSNDESFRPTALGYFNKQILRGDSRGYLFLHDETIFSDPRVDVTATPTDWERKAIVFDYVSCAYKFGSSFTRKWITRIGVTADNETKLALQVNGINDDGKNLHSLNPIIFKSALIWGEEDAVWGDSTVIWNFDGLIDEWRRFPAGSLRSSYKQVQLTNAFVDIDTSETNGLVSVNSTTKVATLESAATADFPTNAVDHVISFSNDSFTQEYTITARTDDTVTFEDVGNKSIEGSFSYKIRGIPKNQILDLVGYCLHVAHLGKTQKPYQGES